MSDFRIAVNKGPRWGADKKTYYTVHIPFFRDEVVIAQSINKDVAVAEMEQFIAEARVALAELKALE